ncbi:SAM-dependent methyltransferase [Bradyrhizobium sp. LHD-71]|uniref:SAM-dependent methyltransferase n=1 Tax=Bradyrhizobium sp. LHD-71 TaxID=3072141 RepID=UPI00280CC56B|nr:SAM-dependent methyltransferase [Bradyrhizobium sp. LHD-71]MDQ8730275.1 SAM-dependent methyltransferase [Bradyrhizobium sp. LHD-71]
MSGFSAEWLALREPLDLRARNRSVLNAVAAAFQDRPELAIVDLGSGTGATVRTLSGRLPKQQRWKLVDDDPVLLAEAFATAPAGVSVETQEFDLNGDVGSLLDGVDLVTASALMDLVSEPWLANLAAAVAARSLPVYVALTYDGRVGFSAFDPVDAQVISAVNAHQRRNKGFGLALGPGAATSAERIFRAFGYSFLQGQSDWIAEASDTRFLVELLDGWRQAADEMGEMPPGALEGWFTRRREAVEAGQLTLSVGHVDFFAQPSGRRTVVPPKDAAVYDAVAPNRRGA